MTRRQRDAGAGCGIGVSVLPRCAPGASWRSTNRHLLPAGLRLVLPAMALLLLSGAGPAATTKPEPTWNGRVDTHGALRAMFHEGQVGVTARMDSLLPNPHLYAVGALADLAGEVTVLGGRAYLAWPVGADSARYEAVQESSAGATLLVRSEVPAWRSVTIARAIPYDELDREIERLIVAAGFDPKTRVPFLLEGTFDRLEWHVIDGRRLMGRETSHLDHLKAAVLETRDRVPATILGFYSANDQGIFTHMGSTTHLHCVIEEPLSSGHVDRVDIPAGVTLKFPVPAKTP